jgi:hypothetical protein
MLAQIYSCHAFINKLNDVQNPYSLIHSPASPMKMCRTILMYTPHLPYNYHRSTSHYHEVPFH